MGDSNYNFYNDMTRILDISNIVHNEKNRLRQKEKGIVSALESQNRMIFLNQSYANRMKRYSYMIMIIAIATVISVFILIFKDFLPSYVSTLLITVILGGAGIWAMFIFMDIQNRDNVDFDKIYSTPLVKKSGNTITSTDSGNFSEIVNSKIAELCVGSACCSAKQIYDSGNNVCSPFTSVEQAYRSGEFNGIVVPNTEINSISYTIYS
jgi:hypothetical protein